jgi:hypothetical protein
MQSIKTTINVRSVNNIIFSNAVSCSTITRLGYTWQQGQDGKFNFIVPTSASSWTVVATFDKAITTFNAWNGVLVGCAGGTVCTFTNLVRAVHKLHNPKRGRRGSALVSSQGQRLME